MYSNSESTQLWSEQRSQDLWILSKSLLKHLNKLILKTTFVLIMVPTEFFSAGTIFHSQYNQGLLDILHPLQRISEVIPVIDCRRDAYMFIRRMHMIHVWTERNRI